MNSEQNAGSCGNKTAINPAGGDGAGSQSHVVIGPDPGHKPEKMLSTEDFMAAVKGQGYDLTMQHKGLSYSDKSTAVVIPATGAMPVKVVDRIIRLAAPQNQKRAIALIEGEEVAAAYNMAVGSILLNPATKNYKYLLTIEHDNIVPIDVHLRLLNTMEKTGFDVVGALYWAKQAPGFPMAFGNPAEGQYHAIPRDVREAAIKGEVMEVNGCAMGATLFKMDIFRRMSPPWFASTGNQSEDKPYGGSSQDLFFCRRAREMGFRIGVDCSVLVGHIDIATGIVW